MQIYQPPSPKIGRKKKIRLVSTTPQQNIYQPIHPDQQTDLVVLTHDELEAMKLKSLNNMHIIQAASHMGVGKSTFANTYNSAIKKVTDALVYGKILYVETAQSKQFVEPIV